MAVQCIFVPANPCWHSSWQFSDVDVDVFYFQLTPVEKYAMKFLESSDDGWAAEAERIAAEIEQQKKEWELGRLQALREEEERMAHNSDEDLLTFSAVDAHNQVNIKKRKGRGRGRTPASPSKKGQVGRPRKSTVFKEREKDATYSDSTTDSGSEFGDDTDEEISTESDMYGSDTSFNPMQKKPSGARIVSNREAGSNSQSNSSGKSVLSKLSEDSPRTRSRGRVKINLWTLDVNPLLPGEKPVPFSKKQLASFRDQGLPIPTSDGSISPSLSEDRSRSSSVQAVNGDMGREEGEVGEDMDVDVVGDSGDSNTLDGTRLTADDTDALEDVAATLKTNGPTQITVQNGLGL